MDVDDVIDKVVAVSIDEDDGDDIEIDIPSESVSKRQLDLRWSLVNRFPTE